MDSVKLWNNKRWRNFESSVYCSGSAIPPSLAEVFHLLEWERINRVLPTTDAMKVLDIGAGGGRWTVAFAPLVSRVVALEPTEAYRVLCKNASPHSNVECHQLSLQQYRPAEKFDLVIISGVLMYIDDDTACERFLRSALGMIRTGGHLLLREPVARKAKQLIQSASEGLLPGDQQRQMSYWEIYRTSRYYAGICEDEGFRVKAMFPSHATVFYHVRIPFKGMERCIRQSLLRLFHPAHMRVCRLYNLLISRIEELIRFLLNIPKTKIIIFQDFTEKKTDQMLQSSFDHS